MDHFDEYSATLTSPYTSGMEVLPSDDTDVPVIPRAMNIIGNTGPRMVRVTLLNDETITLSLSPGDLPRLRVKKIWATGTDFPNAPIALLW